MCVCVSPCLCCSVWR